MKILFDKYEAPGLKTVSITERVCLCGSVKGVSTQDYDEELIFSE